MKTDLPRSITIGLAVLALGLGAGVRAQSPPNAIPTVTVLYPADGISVVEGTPIDFEADAWDSDNGVALVQFYSGVIQIGSADLPPYRATVDKLLPGGYTFTVVATDHAGFRGTSAPVNITIIATNRQPRLEIVSPMEGTTYRSPVTLAVNVNANDPDGTVSGVELYLNDVKVGEKAAAPYQFQVPNLKEGTYRLRAKGTDNLGLLGESKTVEFKVSGQLQPAQIFSVQLTPAFALEMSVVGMKSQPHVIQASRDLKTWTPIFTNIYPVDIFAFTDTRAGDFRYRFYRVVVLP